MLRFSRITAKEVAKLQFKHAATTLPSSSQNTRGCTYEYAGAEKQTDEKPGFITSFSLTCIANQIQHFLATLHTE